MTRNTAQPLPIETDDLAKPLHPGRRFLWLAVGLLTLASAAAYLVLSQRGAAQLDEAPLQRIPKNAPFITTPDPVVDKMIELGAISERDLVYDLGCGDGRIVVAAAVQRGCHGVGFDIDPQRVLEATERAQQQGVSGLVTIKQQDIFAVDLKEANVIVMYLLPWMVEKLTPQFQQLPAGTRIVSHDFKITDAIDQEVGEVTDETGHKHYVYKYVTPLTPNPESPKYRNWK
ncbi:MAG: cyclopropane-fatty-acyl-phospholipid synthase family protein [Pirellulaceae bacterium]